jgi:hypothetical protein
LSGFILAEFATAQATTEAARKAAEAGMPAEDVLSPNPLSGIEEHLAPPSKKPPIGWVMFTAGAVGAVAGYGIQWYSAVIGYPINSGGRPLNSWPAFLLVPYESAILLAAVVGVLGLLWMCGLPALFIPCSLPNPSSARRRTAISWSSARETNSRPGSKRSCSREPSMSAGNELVRSAPDRASRRGL